MAAGKEILKAVADQQLGFVFFFRKTQIRAFYNIPFFYDSIKNLKANPINSEVVVAGKMAQQQKGTL